MKALQRWWKRQHLLRLQRALAEVELAEMEFYRLMDLPMTEDYARALDALDKGIKAYRRFIHSVKV